MQCEFTIWALDLPDEARLDHAKCRAVCLNNVSKNALPIKEEKEEGKSGGYKMEYIIYMLTKKLPLSKYEIELCKQH